MVVLALGLPEGIASAILIACAVWVLAYLTVERMPGRRRSDEQNVGLYLIQLGVLGAIVVFLTAWIKGSF